MLPRSYLTSSDLGMTQDEILRSFASHVEYTLARDEFSATPLDFYQALAWSVRDRLCDRWNKTQQEQFRTAPRRVYYLSMEYLVGRMLGNAMLNLGITAPVREGLGRLGLDPDALASQEEEPGLGNGGLGRLASCFLDTMATLGVPAVGYGIRYEYGIFRQEIVDGAQVEAPDSWLRLPNPWEIHRIERTYPVHFGGRVELQMENGREAFKWVDTDVVNATAYDTPVPGYKNEVVNTMRLWTARASRDFELAHFNQGDYLGAVADKNASENLSRVLYPNDAISVGRELRLRQEFFFVSASLQDAIGRHLKQHAIETLHEHAVFQLNDTHPAVAVAELMRLLLDEHHLEWEEAWAVVTRSFAYTNHTVMSEALEQWSVALFEKLLPRHLMIIYEINRRFLELVRARFPGDETRVRRMSLVAEEGERRVRMAHLAVVGSYSVNGVSELHGRILRERLFADFAQLWPEKFGSQTNGVTPRRWICLANPDLTTLVSEQIGEGWKRDLHQLRGIEPCAEDPKFRAAWRQIKRANKVHLYRYVEKTLGLALDPDALLSVQVKRIHEYKRQLLALLHAVSLHRALRRGEGGRAPRVLLFAGKAAPGYVAAKEIIRLINDVALVINNDPLTRDKLKIVFVPNYSVSLAERIVPAADLSEQISTAGTEASGTGCMKLSMNGALTIGTLDGANIEIRDAVGADNFFLFGLTDAEVEQRRREGYQPRAFVQADPDLRGVMDALIGGEYSPRGPEVARSVGGRLLSQDTYLVMADFASYRECQRRVEDLYRDPEEWTRRAILNVARMGRFSSEATITGYARDIWHIPIDREPPATGK